MKNCSRLYAHLAMLQFQIVVGMISKIKTIHTSKLQQGFNNSGLQLSVPHSQKCSM